MVWYICGVTNDLISNGSRKYPNFSHALISLPPEISNNPWGCYGILEAPQLAIIQISILLNL